MFVHKHDESHGRVPTRLLTFGEWDKRRGVYTCMEWEYYEFFL